MYLRIVFLFSLIFSGVAVFSQQGYYLQGKLIDSINKKPISLSTIACYNTQDSSLVAYRLSDYSGKFRIPLSAKGSFRIVISNINYKTISQEISLADHDAQSKDLGVVQMVPFESFLSEVIVTSERPPVLIKKDTIEFSASAFKTLPNAILNDLLKKLPGVEVLKNGDIYVNGKIVNRILVNGKSFFSNSTKVASENIPATAIKTLSVYDDGDEMEENNDNNKTRVGKVINLTLKKDYKLGSFGKTYLERGTDARYNLGGVFNLFKDTFQVSLLGYSNNINKTSFSYKDLNDIAGFKRSGVQGATIKREGGREGIAINGISFGGIEDGVNTITGTGINLNHTPSKDFSISVQYFFNSNISNVENVNLIEQNLGDTLVSQSRSSFRNKKQVNHILGVNLRWKTKKSETVRFNGSFLSNEIDQNDDFDEQIQSDFNAILNKSSANSRFVNSSHSISFNTSYTRQFKSNKRRTLSISQNFRFTPNKVSQTTSILTDFYYPISSQNQMRLLRFRSQPTLHTGVTASYSQALYKKINIFFRPSLNFSQVQQETDVLLPKSNGVVFDSLNTRLSGTLDNAQFNFRGLIGITRTFENGYIEFGSGYQLLKQRLQFRNHLVNDERFNRSLFTINGNYKSLNFSYSNSLQFPGAYQLNPLVDSSNSAFVSYGNLLLKPFNTTTGSIDGSFHVFNKQMTLFFVVDYARSQLPVTESSILKDNGAQILTYENAGVSENIYNSIKFSKQYKRPHSSISVSVSQSSSIERQPIIYNNNEFYYLQYNINPGASVSLNFKDIFDVSFQYVYRYSYLKYNNGAFPDISYGTNTFSGEMVVRPTKKLIFEAFVERIRNQNLDGRFRNSSILLNTGLSYLMLKENRGQFKLSILDLLNQNQSVNRIALRNGFSTSQTNVLKRYFLFSFLYNFRKNFQEKVGGRNKLLLF